MIDPVYFAVQLASAAFLFALLVFILVIITDVAYDLIADGSGEPEAGPDGVCGACDECSSLASRDLPSRTAPGTTPAVVEM